MKREHAYKLRAMIERAAVSLPDEDALTAVELFPAWAVGTDYKQGDRFRDNDKLFRVLQDHTSQEQWKPGETPSLYAEIEKPGEGDSPSNPIQYNGNMSLTHGKYYAQNGVVYICTRDTVNPVYNDLADLVGLYVEVYAA